MYYKYEGPYGYINGLNMDSFFEDDIKAKIDIDDLLVEDDSESAILVTLRDASSVGQATQSGIQMNALQEAMDNYAKSMNEFAIAKSTGMPVKTPIAQYKGFAAEEYYKHTIKINALAKGVPDYKIGAYTHGELPDGSNLSGIDMEVDISVWTRKHIWSKPTRTVDYQSKMHNDASKYAADIKNAKYESVEFVGGSGQGVNDTVKVKVGNKAIASDKITPKGSEELAADMKNQSTKEYAQRSEKIGELNARSFGNAVAVGAVVGCTVATIQEIISVIKNKDNLSEEQFIESVEHILCGTVEGAARGGAINASVQLLAKMLGKEITSSSLEAVPAMAVANFSIDLAKDLYKCFVEASIDTDDLLCNSVDNLFTSAAGFGGGWLGGQAAGLLLSAKTAAATGASIGSALGPVGTIVGAVIGGVIIGLGARAISNTANKDAYLAFEECISEINSHVELSGIDRLYYFADSMSSLSEHRLSFKDLLPCYNLISDLKEYNLHRKAMRSISNQLSNSLVELDIKKRQALVQLEYAHHQKIQLLEEMFIEQRNAMRNGFRESLDSYVVNSYVQYVEVITFQTNSINELVSEYRENQKEHSEVLDYMRNRNKVNKDINYLIEELMSDVSSKKLLQPLLDELLKFMNQDELLVGRQFVSYDEIIRMIET